MKISTIYNAPSASPFVMRALVTLQKNRIKEKFMKKYQIWIGQTGYCDEFHHDKLVVLLDNIKQI